MSDVRCQIADVRLRLHYQVSVQFAFPMSNYHNSIEGMDYNSLTIDTNRAGPSFSKNGARVCKEIRSLNPNNNVVIKSRI